MAFQVQMDTKKITSQIHAFLSFLKNQAISAKLSKIAFFENLMET
jgi:hypothetical protein